MFGLMDVLNSWLPCSCIQKLSCCLASLPKSRGDEDSWSLMMQKVLLSLSSLLNSTLEGLEEGIKCICIKFVFLIKV